jgi:ABC-type uncharacterized transport system permease subunit
VAGHLLEFLVVSVAQHKLPFGTMWDALALSTLVLSCSYLAVERIARSKALGGPFYLLAAAGSAMAALNDGPDRLPMQLRSPLFALHVTLGTVGIGLLAAAGLLAAGWLLQYRLLRRRTFGGLVQNLPDLSTLERLFLALSALGTILLSIGAVLGWIWMRSDHYAYSTVFWKSGTVLLAIFWNAGILAVRQRNAWSSGWMAWMGFLGLVPLGLVVWAGTRVF